jgi:Protein CHAPERONE-LIKE PROTEIN OF POR1-like
MKETNPYAIFGIEADAPFEEVQQAKMRILASLEENDRRRLEIEAAYDTILMQRLQLRKEGKVRVPDRIRYPETALQPPPAAVKSKTPAWWEGAVQILPLPQAWIPIGVFSALYALSWLPSFPPYLVLSLALVAATYFLQQKNRRLFRALGLSLAAFIFSYVLVMLVVPGLLFPSVGLGLILLTCLVAVWCLV